MFTRLSPPFARACVVGALSVGCVAVMLLSMAPILKPKELAFATEYLAGATAAEADVKAGYSAKGARTEGPKRLQKPAVQAYLAAHQTRVVSKTEVLQDRILQELQAMAFANIGDYTRLNAEGQRDVDFSNATREQLSAITKVRNKTRKIYNGKGDHVATEVDQSFDMADKYRGMELLGRHLGMFKEAEQRVVVDVADRLLTARKRVLNAEVVGNELLDEGEVGSE